MIKEGFACYHFYPRADVPIKVIVLDDTDKSGLQFLQALSTRNASNGSKMNSMKVRPLMSS